MKNWFRIILLIIVLAVLGGVFYWYEWRPSQIRIRCNDSAFNSSMASTDASSYTQNGRMELKDKFYKDCLRYEGLEK
ncbi:hypothetical protein COX24_00880 [bacterium (Candidatus Gribaldobacteria) CG23_combo_of_CG06-09_8_20_14_all_37_87_8]|uniref:Uncharacterized protein n=2 Tax=Candidatus Gribaldobacteria TaxID=2798536 RepID=A0A2G9ZFM1_9BACT|nr:MAG: hypothetical protein COX24_00880 [bacterium (Candidatus Gribaldobacteria) CG23_combo_of_CG06-09_8_20_14_all_37_87_8]PIR90182.1 MAG: hypothetical protein COU05_02750 [bacterium (Candidatus Gribaldobacteria) CG10_big_fil_rev_8_21_14_0_10_37_21]